MHLQLCLLFVAAILPGSASSEEGVTLKCDNIEATVGHNIILHCSVNFTNVYPGSCSVERSDWSNSGSIICKTNEDVQKDPEDKNYTCGVDNITHELYLNISGVRKDAEESYNIAIITSCGFAYSNAIVRVNIIERDIGEETGTSRDRESANMRALIGIFVTLAVVGIVVYLATARRGRHMVNHAWVKMTQRHRNNADPAPQSEAASGRLMDV